ncbi:hypothetical protein Hanom_Chr11g01026101 [Helianthus anomalus]
MKPWSVSQRWTLDRDVPMLPKSMMNLIPSDSLYRLKHEELLNKLHTPTDAPTKEVYDYFSSPEEEVQKSWALDSEPAEENTILIIRNSPEILVDI